MLQYFWTPVIANCYNSSPRACKLPFCFPRILMTIFKLFIIIFTLLLLLNSRVLEGTSILFSTVCCPNLLYYKQGLQKFLFAPHPCQYLPYVFLIKSTILEKSGISLWFWLACLLVTMSILSCTCWPFVCLPLKKSGCTAYFKIGFHFVLFFPNKFHICPGYQSCIRCMACICFHQFSMLSLKSHAIPL